MAALQDNPVIRVLSTRLRVLEDEAARLRDQIAFHERKRCELQAELERNDTEATAILDHLNSIAGAYF